MERHLVFPAESIAHTRHQLFIGGRALSDAIRVGDCFSCMRRWDEQTSESGIVGIPINLTVLRILVYGKYVDQVDRGVTAEIEFSGDLSIRIGPDDLLLGESDVPPAKDAKDIEVYGEGCLHVLAV